MQINTGECRACFMCNFILEPISIYIRYNHTICLRPFSKDRVLYLDWAFANLKRLGRGGEQNGPPSNLAISSQMMMKFGKDILCLKIFTN